MVWNWQKTAAVVVGAALWFALVLAVVNVIAAPARASFPVSPAAMRVAKPEVDDTLRALARLHEFGYTISTPARADRAIRHWQRVNGLTVDGIVGPETLASLDMTVSATASAPAARTTPPPAPAADAGMPETIIRDVWPDELEDQALAIATRESRLVPSARNACCYGLFQIHWGAHRDWLAGLGITSPAELLEARTNATAAYALYQLDGWAPWSL
jgi:peptidoglycan hydrolase-like protein with peptidoglycan-binding domain